MILQKLREERANLISQARALLDAAEGENRDLSQEEQNQYDTLFNKADELRGRIERGERQADAERQLNDRAGDAPLHTNQQPGEGEDRGQDGDDVEQRQMNAFRRLLPAWISNDYRAIPRDELRALQADLDVSGGYLQPPEQFVSQLLKNVDDMTFIRQLATTITVTNADSLGVPTLDNDPADATWTSELGTGDEDSTMSFGKRELNPHPLAKRIKVSRKLMRAVPNADSLVRERLAYKFGITFEKACLTGNGAGQPLGLFTASTNGISTGRDNSTGNTTTAITFDNLIDVKYTLKSQYHGNANWLFHRDALKMISKLKDNDGQYLWRESVRAGEPDRILNIGVVNSEYAPNTFTASQYVGLLGDFKNYWIADALTLEFQLLQELYAESNQVGLIGRLESDGMPVLEEAFVRVQLAAS